MDLIADSGNVGPWLGVLALTLAAGAAAVAWQRERHWSRPLVDVFHTLPYPAQVVGHDGTPLWTNPAGARWLGRDARALPKVLEAYADDGESRDAITGLCRDAVGPDGGRGEVRLRLADGGTAWYAVRAYRISRPPGAVAWFAEDVTPRRRMEERLRGEQQRLVGLLDHAPVGFHIVDADGRFEFANTTLATWLGVRPGDLTGGNWRLHDVVPEAAGRAPAYSAFPASHDQDRVPDAGRAVMRTVTGQRITVQITQEVVREADGNRPVARAVLRNLTREEAVTAAVERSEQRLRSFFEHAPVGIAVCTEAGEITACNQAFAELLQRNAGNLRGAQLPALVQASDRSAVESALNRADTAADEPPEAWTPDHGCVFTVVAKQLAADAGGERVVYLIDRTRHKELEQQFVQSQKMQAIGQLAGAVAHDFNNLLTAMIGFCDLLLLRHRAGDQSFADLMQIKQNANRAANLVRQLLAFSRQQTLRPTVLSITDVLVEFKHLLQRLIGETITLEIHHGSGLYPVKADQGQFEQVIINLAVNARDAMADTGGHLEIRTVNEILDTERSGHGETVPAGTYVRVDVSDTGCGIPPESLERIFEPFYSTKEIGEGTGLGLATVYGIIKQTGGYIQVHSVVGNGTTFSIYLPRHEESEELPAERARDGGAPHDLTGMGSVLLVEDEEAVRSFAARALRKKGYTVFEAQSGEEALGVLTAREQRVDLLITDVVMPEVDGPALVARIREVQPDVPVIYISGYAEDSVRSHLDSTAGAWFLGKPFSLKQLAGTVKDALYQSSAS